jgi:hypothetical protein
MCFSRRSFWRDEEIGEGRKDPTWEDFDREHEAERVQSIADRERSERDAERDREKVPAGIGV